MAEIVTYTSYKNREIKYISFARWYVVFTTKKDGSTKMNHFLNPSEAKDFIDHLENEKDPTKFWWE